jgi:hypothetical protein
MRPGTFISPQPRLGTPSSIIELKLCAINLGKIWKNIHTELPPSLRAPKRKKRSRRLRPRSYFFVSSPPFTSGSEDQVVPQAGPDSQRQYNISILDTRMYTQLSSYSRPFSFSFVSLPLQNASSQAVAPWFSMFSFQIYLPLFSLSIGFPELPAPRAFYLDALALSPANFIVFLRGMPFFCSYSRAPP